MKTLDIATYREAIGQMVHFSFKSVNSNAPPGGIRLTKRSGHALRYVSARSLLRVGVHLSLDYTKNVGAIATITKQLRQVLSRQVDVPSRDRESIEAAYEAALRTPLEVGTQTVSPRMPQVLLPKPGLEGGYVSMTPLPAAGTAVLINEFVRPHNDRLKTTDSDENSKRFRAEHRRIRTAQLGLGGSNPQNLGSLVRDLQTVVVIEAPRERPGVRQAFALFYRGPELRLDRRRMQAYAAWRSRVRALNDGRMPTRLAERIEECEQVRQLALAALHNAERQCQVLRTYCEILPVETYVDDVPSMFAQQVPAVLKGIVEPGWRRTDWPREMARLIAQLVVKYRLEDGATLGLNDGDRDYIAGWIEEAL